MAEIIRGANESVITSMFSYRDDRAVESLRDSYANNDRYSSRFRERIRETHEDLRNDRAYRLATAAMRKLKNVRREDRIEQLWETGSIQHARKRMRNYIMTSRFLCDARRRGLIEGYGDDYELESPERRHTNRYVQDIEDGLVQEEDGKLIARTYYREEPRMEAYDRGEVLITRRAVERRVREGRGDDPTSKFNAVLTAVY